MRPHPRRPPRAPAAPAATPAAPRRQAEKPQRRQLGGAAAAGGCCKAGDTTPPLDLVKATPKGGLVNPYRDQLTDPAKLAAIGDEGHKKYLSFSCNGCHGGGGGGGMCPPLTNDTWVYSPDDDTLFRLIALGSDGLKQAGYSRVHLGGRGRPDAALRRNHQDLGRFVESHLVHPLGEPELDQERGRHLPAEELLSASSTPDPILKAAKLGDSLAAFTPSHACSSGLAAVRHCDAAVNLFCHLGTAQSTKLAIV